MRLVSAALVLLPLSGLAADVREIREQMCTEKMSPAMSSLLERSSIKSHFQKASSDYYERVHHSYRNVVQDVLPSTVTVATGVCVYDESSPLLSMMPYSCSLLQGSGIVVDKEGLLVTNRHVTGEKYAVMGADVKMYVETSDGKLFKAEIVNRHPIVDLALLNLTFAVQKDQSLTSFNRSEVEFTPISFANSSDTSVGDIVMALGDNYGLENSVTMGVISAFRQDPSSIFNPYPTSQKDGKEDENSFLSGEISMPKKHNQASEKPALVMTDALNSSMQTGIPVVIQHDASINHGNSGGALVNLDGELVGLNTMKIEGTGSSAASGLGFAVPTRYIEELIMLADHKTKQTQDRLKGYLRSLFEKVYGSIDDSRSASWTLDDKPLGVTKGKLKQAPLQQQAIIKEETL